jgi:hypothetical protein
MSNKETTMHKESIIHKETRTWDIRGSLPAWGYVHQIFFFIIVFCQSSTCTESQDPTLHMTGYLRALR